MQSTISTHCTGFESFVGMSRRRFLSQFGMGLGSIALALIGNISLRKAAIGVFGLGIIAIISTAAFTWMMSELTPNLPA